ncbi:MAG: hypothetical protein EOP87_20595, partial [Verrucomicrobiaceae bacterium]
MKTLLFLWLAILPLHAQTGDKLVTAAREQIGVVLYYDSRYTPMEFPNGDVPADPHGGQHQDRRDRIGQDVPEQHPGTGQAQGLSG